MWIYFKINLLWFQAKFSASYYSHTILRKSFWFAAQKNVVIILMMLKTAEYIFNFRFLWWIEVQKNNVYLNRHFFYISKHKVLIYIMYIISGPPSLLKWWLRHCSDHNKQNNSPKVNIYAPFCQYFNYWTRRRLLNCCQQFWVICGVHCSTEERMSYRLEWTKVCVNDDRMIILAELSIYGIQRVKIQYIYIY